MLAGSYVAASISPHPARLVFFHLLLAVSYIRACQFVGVAIVTSVSHARVEDPPPHIVSILS